jgi:hypothetical protein
MEMTANPGFEALAYGEERTSQVVPPSVDSTTVPSCSAA